MSIIISVIRKLLDNYEIFEKEVMNEETKKIININTINKDTLIKYLKQGAIKNNSCESIGHYSDLLSYY